MLKIYYKSFNLPIKIVRPFNTYGPRQSARAIIPTIISQLLENNKTISLGSMSPKRDLTYVLDTCKGFLSIYNCNQLFGLVTNIGMNKSITIGELVSNIAETIGVEIKIKTDRKIKDKPISSANLFIAKFMPLLIIFLKSIS